MSCVWSELTCIEFHPSEMDENVGNKRRLGNNFSPDKLPEGFFHERTAPIMSLLFTNLCFQPSAGYNEKTFLLSESKSKEK